MTDLVKRLRDRAMWRGPDHQLLEEAADRITEVECALGTYVGRDDRGVLASKVLGLDKPPASRGIDRIAAEMAKEGHQAIDRIADFLRNGA